MSKYLLLTISILFLVQGFAQGRIDGFYKGQGAGSAVLGFGYEDSKKYYAGDMKLDLGRTVVYGSIFVDYGITQDLDASVSLPYIASDDNSDFQDMALWLKYRLFDQALSSGNLEFSVAGGFSTPVSDYELGGLNDIGQQATIIDLRGMVHYKINSGWFVTLQSGYSFKLEETPNSIPVTLKAGHAGSNWYYDLFYDYQHSLEELTTEAPSTAKFQRIRGGFS